MPPTKFKALTLKKDLVAKGVYSISLGAEDNNNFEFKAGQYLLVDVGSGLKRHYSIASSPLVLDHFELLIDLKPGGPGSVFFDKLMIDDTVEILGPMGNFILPENTKQNLIFLATGTGLAPIKSMIDTLILNGSYKSKNIYLYYGTRYNDHVIFKDNYVELQGNGILKDFKICLSQEVINEPRYLNGYVTLFLKEIERSTLLDSDIFVCGGGQIVKSIVDVVKNEGILESNIYYERFS